MSFDPTGPAEHLRETHAPLPGGPPLSDAEEFIERAIESVLEQVPDVADAEPEGSAKLQPWAETAAPPSKNKRPLAELLEQYAARVRAEPEAVAGRPRGQHPVAAFFARFVPKEGRAAGSPAAGGSGAGGRRKRSQRGGGAGGGPAGVAGVAPQPRAQGGVPGARPAGDGGGGGQGSTPGRGRRRRRGGGGGGGSGGGTGAGAGERPAQQPRPPQSSASASGQPGGGGRRRSRRRGRRGGGGGEGGPAPAG